MLPIFSLLVGMSLVILLYSHFLLLREKISVDRIIPECFRGCRYGACAYYKEFYDPVQHKTPKPFSTDIKVKKPERVYNIERNDYNNTQWNIKWIGKMLKNEGKVFTDESEVAVFKQLPKSDNSRISETTENELPSLSQNHDQLNTISQEDITDERI
tara:strand:- start:20 stop:490 length:471 start_codon:yes stop_codon:yes gene_type:complete